MNKHIKIILTQSPFIFLVIIAAVTIALFMFQRYIITLQNSSEIIEITSLNVNETVEITAIELVTEDPFPLDMEADNPFYEGILLLESDRHNEGIKILENVDPQLLKTEWASDVLNPWGQALITINEYLKAVEILKGVPEESSGRARSDYLTGLAYYYLGENDKAAFSYLSALNKLPGYYSASFNLGTLYLKINKPDESIKYLEAAAASSGGKRKAKAYYNLGLAYSRVKLYVSASEAYNKSVNFNPSETRARLNLARLNKDFLDQTEKAVELYREVLAVEPSNISAVLELSSIYAERGEEINAAKLLDTVIEKNPDSITSREALASILFTLNRVEESEKHLLWIVSHGDSSFRARFLMGRIAYSRRKFKSARTHYERALEICDTCYIEAWNNLGLTLMALGEIDEAKNAYNSALMSDSSYIKARYNLGLAWLEEGNENNALENFEKVLDLESDHISALYNIAVIFGHQEKFTLAVNTYMKVLEIEPDNRKARLNLANIYKNKGEIEKAIEHYIIITRLNPLYTSAWFNLALAYKNGGNYIESEKAYLKCISLDSDNSGYRNNLAVLYVEEEKYEEAEEQYRIAISGDTSNPQYVYNLGILFKKQKRIDAAEEEFRKAVKLDSGFVPALIQIGDIVRSQKNYLEASEIYSSLIILEPDDYDHLYNKGKSLYYAKNYTDAENDLKKLLEYSREDPWAWYYLGKIYQKTNRKEDSESAFIEVGRLDPGMNNYILGVLQDEPDSYDFIKKLNDENPSGALQFYLSEALFKQKEYAEAEKEIRKLINQQPRNFRAVKLLANILEKLDKHNEAAEYWLKTLTFNGSDGEVYYRLALIYKKTNEIDKMEDALQNAVSLIPSHWKSWELFGESYYEKKNYKLASDAFEKSIESGGKKSYIYLSLGKSHYRLEEYESALEWFKKASSKKDDIWYKVWEARAYARLNKREVAVEIYNGIIKKDPDFIQSYIGLGDIYSRGKNYETAHTWYLKALEIDPLHQYSRKKAEQMESRIGK